MPRLFNIANGFIETMLWADCEEFPNAPISKAVEKFALDKAKELLADFGGELDSFDPMQIGHDLYLSIFEHGAGFFARPNIYGPKLTRRLDKWSNDHRYFSSPCLDDNGEIILE